MFLQSPVINRTYADTSSRVEIQLTVSLGTDVTKLEAILRETALGHPRVLRVPMPIVRFVRVAASELPELSVEVSVLGPLEPVDPIDPAAIAIGRHGLVAEQGHRRGLLLPQVAGEHGWSAEEFLQQTCLKAGLPADAWRHGARIWRFDAEVFGE